MGEKKRLNIGLIVGNVEDDFSNSICKGAMKAAEEVGDNLFIFPAKYIVEKGAYDSDPKLRYEYQYSVLVSYAKSKSLDVILLCLSSIGYKTTRDVYIKVLEQLVDIPIVLISCEEEGYDYPSIMFDNASGLKVGITRLIEEKNLTRIGMVAGEPDNLDAQERLQTYKNVLTEHNLEVLESRIVHGDYTERCKPNLQEWFARNTDLEAVICISDTISKVLYEVIKEHNLKIGQDIFVIGFDDIEDAVHMDPPLATVRADASMLGYYGVIEGHSMMEKIREKQPIRTGRVVVPTNYIERESATGIKSQEQKESLETLMLYKQRYYNVLDIDHQMNIVNRDMLMFGDSNSSRYCEFLEAFSIAEIKSCYMYLFYREIENTDSLQWQLPPSMYLRAFRKGDQVTELPRTKQRISVDHLFDHEYLGDERKTYMLIDIYSREMQYGIFMCELPYEYLHFVEMICYQISTAIKIMGLFATQKDLIEDKENMLRKLEQENLHLDNISNMDALTSVYNRRGLMSRLNKMLNKKENKGKSAIIVYADLNYLKQINDSFGHEEGDFAICLCVDALKSVLGEEAIIGRIGGDEFVAGLVTEHKPKEYQAGLNDYFEQYNAKQKKVYEITLSAGIFPFVISDGISMDELLEQADDLLYENKRRKGKFIVHTKVKG